MGRYDFENNKLKLSLLSPAPSFHLWLRYGKLKASAERRLAVSGLQNPVRNAVVTFFYRTNQYTTWIGVRSMTCRKYILSVSLPFEKSARIILCLIRWTVIN